MIQTSALRKTVFIATLVIVSSLSACKLWNRRESNKISISGNIELTQVNMAFKMPGELIDLRVDEGDGVQKGMLLARLDVDQLEKQRARDQETLAIARTQLPQQQTLVDYQKAALEADVEARKAALRQAEARLQQLLAGSRTQEIRQAQAAVREAEDQHQLAQKDWERAQLLYKNDDISTAQHDQYRSRYEITRAALQQAQERLSLVKEGPRKEDIESARAQVEQAKAGIRQAEAMHIEIKRREQELETRNAQIRQAQAQVAVIDTQISDATLVAPINGVVLVKSAEAGEVLAAGATLLTLGEIDKPWLRGYIREQDYGRVKLGMKAKVTTDSYPGKVYWGRITFISSEAEFTPKQIQTPEERVKLVYRIKIELDNPRHELKLNMPADAEIVLENGK
jgi:HlyD family secretion protein